VRQGGAGFGKARCGAVRFGWARLMRRGAVRRGGVRHGEVRQYKPTKQGGQYGNNNDLCGGSRCAIQRKKGPGIR